MTLRGVWLHPAETRLTAGQRVDGLWLVAVPRMHDEEVDVDGALVRRLLSAQAPDLAHLPLHRVEAWGTDHAIFRLGDELSVRVPKIGWAARQGPKEARWLGVLAPHLPVEVPVPVFVGEPGSGYPYHWYASPWLDGENPVPSGPTDQVQLAVDLAAFVHALQAVGASGAPEPTGGRRGGPLAAADEITRNRAEDLRGETDVDALVAVWDAGLSAPVWDGPLVWAHGDLSDGNLLVRDGRLSGVIDWGSSIAGDPAVELMVAWNLFDAPARDAYREALGFVDDAMWLRGRAWAVSAAILALPYDRDTNPDICARSWRAVHAALADIA